MAKSSDSLSPPPLTSSSPPRKKRRSRATSKTSSTSKSHRVPKYKNEGRGFVERLQCSYKVGSHCSSAGGAHQAVLNAATNGSNAFALFIGNQRQWKSKNLSQEDVDRFESCVVEHNYDKRHILPHGNYLINMGSAKQETQDKSMQCFINELQNCEKLGLRLYNFHPGSSGHTSVEACCKKIGECISLGQEKCNNVTILVENMAGQGSTVGKNFEELRMIIDTVKDKSRVGVCLDTCHLFASGYDISTRESYSETMNEFDEVVGLKYLKALHLNDSLTPCNSKKDRHHNIGAGHIGLDAFRYVMTDDRLKDLPMILETPASEKGEDIWSLEIELLHSLHNKLDDRVGHLSESIRRLTKLAI